MRTLPLSRRAAVMAICLAPVAAMAKEAPAAALERHISARLGEALSVQAVRRFGAVSLVDIAFAVRANSHEQLAVVAADGTVLLVADAAQRLRGEIEGAADGAFLNAGTQRFLRRQGFADGGQRLVFAVPIQDGCRACAVVAIARIAIDFDADGRVARSLHLSAIRAQADVPWESDPRL